MEELLERWLERMKHAGVPPQDPKETTPIFLSWLRCLDQAQDGAEDALHELTRLVAVYARSLGTQERPASILLRQLQALEEEAPTFWNRDTRKRIRQLLPLVVDAHGAGLWDRLERRHKKLLRSTSPVLRILDRCVVAFFLGPIERDTLDGLLGRLFTETARARAPWAILDIADAEEENDLLYRTLVGFGASPEPFPFKLIISGLKNPNQTQKTLESLSCKMARLRLSSSTSKTIESLLTDIPV